MGQLTEIAFGVDLLSVVADQIVHYPAATRPKIRVLLPHRRACRRLRSLLIRQGGLQLLPKISPLGEPDTAEFSLDEDGFALWPEVSSQTRWLLLSWLLNAARKSDHMQGTAEQDSKMAHSLAAVMDRLGEFDRTLAHLVMPEHEDFAEHWGRAAKLLDVVKVFWPNWCQEQQRLDPIQRRNAALRYFADGLENKQENPVIIAGSSGRALAVQYAMKAVLDSPQGHVYLQGTEVIYDPKKLSAPSHPGFALAGLLRNLARLPNPQNVPDTTDFYRWAFRALGAVGDMPPKQVPTNLQALILPDRQTEIAVTAMVVRAGFDQHPDGDIAVICQDNAFIDGLERWLARWNIALDRVAGLPIQRTPEGRLAHLVLDIWCHGLDTVRFLALLKHPLVCLGQDRAAVQGYIRQFEATFQDGYDDGTVDRLFEKAGQKGYEWLNSLFIICDKLENQNFKSFSIIWQKTIQTLSADNLAENYASPAMQTLQDWWQQLQQSAMYLPLDDMTVEDFAGFVLPMFVGLRAPTPTKGAFSVSVLSAMEARLMRFDRVIIPMMNYGVMPAPATPEPWMSRQQYQECSMPPPEETIGLAAHDFIELCHQPEVFLLRAEKIADEVVAASSWWDRLDAAYRLVSGRSLVSEQVNQSWLAWLRILVQAADNPSLGRPQPIPSVEMRPNKLSVTEIQALFLNPYDIYARRILSVRERNIRKQDSYAQRRGIMLHQLAQDFVAVYANTPILHPQGWLVDHAKQLLAGGDFSAVERLNLQFAVQRMADRFIRIEGLFKGVVNHVELAGQWTVAGVTLNGRADRIVQSGQSVAIIDYKSGAFPSDKDVIGKYEWQLPLLRLMLRSGAFDLSDDSDDSDGKATLSYWRIGGSKQDKLHQVFSDYDDENEEFFENLLQELTLKLQDFQQETMAFAALPDPNSIPKFVAAKHLMRADEWLEQVTEDDDESDY